MRRVLIGLAVLVGVVVIAFAVSPWPSVYVIRTIFDSGAASASEKLVRYLPADIAAREGLRYGPGADERFDIFMPAAAKPGSLPVIVWAHGGGFVSGRRGDIANYLKILAGRGFMVVNLDYTIAPEATYPRPIEQVNRALGHLAANAGRLGLGDQRFILAGDSAGAQIAAQVANIVTSPGYAKAVGIAPAIGPERLAGALLFCGPYDLALMKAGGIGGWFMATTTWAYSGKRDHRDAPGFALMSVARHITPAFPPAFVTAGNGDPLAPHSVALAKALASKGVTVETLFFPADRKPPLGHEYQFDLDEPAARVALERAVAFAKRVGS
jgi:acetyl esterase